MKISVFGGSQAHEGSSAYQDAEGLGRSLAQMGHSVLTGGYSGTMEAVSRGAASAGGHVIGVTSSDLHRFHGRQANAWVAEEWRKPTLITRLQALIEGCDAALALPGGPGTLTEVALTWNLMIVGALRRQPMILIGAAWQSVFNEFFETLGEYVPPAQRELISFAGDVHAAVDMLSALTNSSTTAQSS